LQDQMNQGVDEAEKQERAARWAILALSGIALLVGLLVTWLSHRALRPIRTLTEAAQRLGRGSPDSVAVPEQGGDELAALAREFNAMAQRLAARERELRAQGEALLRSERLAAIGRIAAQITHEIRNPLSSISLNAEELGERAPHAREAMPAGGSLRVTTRVTRGAVEIEVRDTGPGIPPDRLARIFDPFFTTKERGTGLGLAMAQEIAQEHGGQLFCDSAPGRGTAF